MGSKNPPPDERVVYLALKNIFKGQNAQVRKNKTVAKLIKHHKTQESVANLLREYNFDVVCGLASNLLSAEIFDSTLKAKVRFPELLIHILHRVRKKQLRRQKLRATKQKRSGTRYRLDHKYSSLFRGSKVSMKGAIGHERCRARGRHPGAQGPGSAPQQGQGEARVTDDSTMTQQDWMGNDRG
ncbi:hypothetical protein NLG97_g10817 [Lecanicillium saksenae]|uniref:Uncharacterized protein n=1 Tax=Lecanicillium saksenae TaxID=468837 RepID=A0ACC1QC45_9HYPO|nr:hypothetical protein NLG97_g10817 [Lecanicillium saksenae]